MARRIASVVGGLVVLLAALLTAPTQAAVAATPTQMAPRYGYDGHHRDERPVDAVTERGPPRVDGQLNTHNAVSHRPHGSSTRPKAGGPYGYDTRPQLAQGDNIVTTTSAPAPAVLADVAPDPPMPSGVAANSAPKALNASSRVAPWAGSSLSRLSREGEVMYRVYGGGAGQAGSWITPINPISSAAARQGLALPVENAALYVSRVTLPGGVRMQVGTAGSAFGQPGGWAQAQLLERIPLSSFGKGVPLP